MDRRGGFRILVLVFLSYQYFVIPALFEVSLRNICHMMISDWKYCS